MLPTFSTDLLRSFEALPGMYLILSPELYILTASNAYCSAVTKIRSEIRGKYIFEVFPIREDEAEELRIDYSLSKVIETRKSHYLPIIRFDGPGIQEKSNIDAYYWQSSNHPVFDDNGELFYIIHQIEAVNERLGRFFMQAPAGICILDGPDFVFELVNPHYQELFPDRELKGRKLMAALPELKNTPIPKMIEHVFNTGDPFEGREMLIPLARTKNGPIEERYFNFIYQARLNIHGNIDGVMVFVFEVTEVVLNRLKDRERENRFKFLLNAVPQQVWTARPDGQLDYVNEVVSQDFGRSIVDIVGSGWQSFIHPDDLPDCLSQWMESLTHGSEYMVEFRLLFADGTYKWHLARAIPFIEHGQITLWLGTNTNIEFQKTNERRKDEFLSIASHELKTPLTSIKAFNQLMLRANDVASMQDHLEKSSENIVRLEKLIDDLLDVTKITAGKMQYNMEEFDFHSIVEDVVSGAKLLAIHHDLILESNEQTLFYGDRFRLEQVLHNFLNNAIKYSPDGKKIIINSKVDKENLIVSIQDFGIGIPKHEISRLFERYYRVDNTVMRFEGLGLGLFIASEILKRHRGNFWLESEEGVGSTFFFKLPISNYDLMPVKERPDFYQDESVIIKYNKQFERLELDWLGHQNIKTVKQGCLKTLEMILRFKVKKILNNNTNVVGSWSDASEWVGAIFYPMMEKKGIHSIAWVYSSNAFSQLSANKSVDVATGNISTQFFVDFDEAHKWINSR